MRFRLTIFALLTCFMTELVSGQVVAKLPYHVNSYHLLLPRDWLKPKLIRAITEILPLTIEQLKGKDFCTNCTADYTVLLVLDSIAYQAGDKILRYSHTITDSFPDAISGVTGIYASLRLLDSNGRAITDLRLFGTDEDISAVPDYVMRMEKLPPAIPYDIELVRGSKETMAYLRRTDIVNNLPSTPVYRQIPNSNLVPLMKLCEKRIYEIRRILRRLVNADPS